jgi:hypothetical protein
MRFWFPLTRRKADNEFPVKARATFLKTRQKRKEKRQAARLAFFSRIEV